ncbi:MAG: hypothetical protein GX883_07700 [Firmicutes bacterium]|nr:hypothetical protein [Bacillota bacterium]
MIWYTIPEAVSGIIFVGLLLTTAAQIIVVLEAGELLRDREALRFIRLRYSLLALVSAALTLEAITAIASIEGGLYLELRGLLRYTAILPALLCLYSLSRPARVPPLLQPQILSSFVPLFYLPPLARLPGPLPAALTAFAAAWLLCDAAGMLLAYRAYGRSEISRDALAQIIRRIDYGICVADRRGWILERNRAFMRKCLRLGIPRVEQIVEFDRALEKLEERGRLKKSELEEGSSIRAGNSVFYLQRSIFRTGGKRFTQLSISDVTETSRTAAELEQENERLARSNSELEAAITFMQLEETMRERERLCRSAHDHWSQQLAVAGLLIDSHAGKGYHGFSGDVLVDITELLEEPAGAETAEIMPRLSEVLQGLEDMYRRLGIDIEISGAARFAPREEEALAAVIREALANAVRHAYARQIDILFYDDGETRGVEIQNECLDDSPAVVKGRGLHDMENRIRQTGGEMEFRKGAVFLLKAAFPIC